MDNIQVFITLILIRLIIPVGILLLMGEWNRYREARNGLRNQAPMDFTLQSSLSLRQTLEDSQQSSATLGVASIQQI
jgi:hypothetical protein